jgi:hypothetical protein
MTTTISTLNAKQQDAQDKADAQEKMAIKLGVETDAQSVPLRDAEGNLIALQPGDVGYSAEKSTAAQTAIDNASEFQSQADNLGTQTRVLQALGGAVGNNVTGSLGSLAQSTLANVAQSFGVQQIKTIADSFGETAKDANGKELTNSDGTKIFKPTETSEAVRTALQGLAACAGQAAGGGECSSAALGAASSVVLNNLFATGPGGNAALHPDGSPLTPEEQTERANLVSTLVASLTTALGGDANAATTSAIIETLNNAVTFEPAKFKYNILFNRKLVNGGLSTAGVEQFYKACAATGDVYCKYAGTDNGQESPNSIIAQAARAFLYHALAIKDGARDVTTIEMLPSDDGILAPSPQRRLECDMTCQNKVQTDMLQIRIDLANAYDVWLVAHPGQHGDANLIYDIHANVWTAHGLSLVSFAATLGTGFKSIGVLMLGMAGY